MTRIVIAMPATEMAMRMIVTIKIEAMTVADDRPVSGVVSGMLDDTGDISDAEVDDEVLEEIIVWMGESTCSFK